MTRQPRALSDSGLYHIVFRGVNHENIFESEADYDYIHKTIQVVKNELGFELYAYCYMYDDTENYTQLAYKDENGWDSKLYYNSRKIENPDYFTVNPSNLEWEKSTHKQYGIINQKKWTSSIATSLLGFSLKRETYENDNQKFATYGNSSSALKAEANFGEYSLNEYSLFGSYDRKLSSLTNAIFSFREDAFKSDAGDYNAFLPQFQILTKLNGVSSLYASVGKSFRMPTFRNLYYSSAIVKPNPDLKPEHDASDPTKIIGGNVTVKSATKDSAITLRTDSSGIDMTNDESLRSIFTNMAQKLTYSAYTSGEDNLDGYVEIAEGLTAGAVAQKISDITFDKTTGKGSVGNDILTPINAVITGNITKDSTYVDRGILTVDDDKSTYNFTQKTIINNTINVEGATPNPSNMKYAIAINPDAGKEVILNMNSKETLTAVL